MTLEEINEQIKLVDEKERYQTFLEADLADTKERIRKIREEIIPEGLMELGVTELALTDGRKIGYEKHYYASLPSKDKYPEKRVAALSWLKDNGHNAIIKQEIKMAFGPDQLSQVNAKMAENLLTEAEIDFTNEESVHPQTLKAFVKNMMEAGKQIPADLFSIHTPNVMYVTEPKKKVGK